MRMFSLALVVVAAAGMAIAGEKSSPVMIKPVAIALDSPPVDETQRSCVVHHHQGGMNVLSVAATDPAIRVDLRETHTGTTYVVSATLPAGYPVTAGRGPVHILVQTDLSTEPLIRIPVHVWPERKPDRDVWLRRAKQWIGQPLPTITADRLEGGEMEIQAQDGEVTVLVFSAHWCGHCDTHLPVIEGVMEDYADLPVRFIGIAGGIGSGIGIVDGIERWKVNWPIGIDRGLLAAQQFGVKAYPVVFVVSPNGFIESVHGRWSNTGIDNGLDDLGMELRTEIDILLAGGTRADFPDWVQLKAKPPLATRPATTRPAQAAMVVAPEVRHTECEPGVSTTFKVPVRNLGLRTLRLLKVSPAEGVSVHPDYVKEIPPGGLGMIRCEVDVPSQPGAFSRRIEIRSDDPDNPVTTITLVGDVTTIKPSTELAVGKDGKGLSMRNENGKLNLSTPR